MANRLKMATSDTIRTLAEQGWSARRIAKTLGLHRDTVARHLGRGKLGQAPTGSATVQNRPALSGSSVVQNRPAPTGSEADPSGAPVGDGGAGR